MGFSDRHFQHLTNAPNTLKRLHVFGQVFLPKTLQRFCFASALKVGEVGKGMEKDEQQNVSPLNWQVRKQVWEKLFPNCTGKLLAIKGNRRQLKRRRLLKLLYEALKHLGQGQAMNCSPKG